MFHNGAQTLIDAWSLLPDSQRIPARLSIDPAAFGPLLPQVFVADRTEDGARFRFAGGWVETFHGRPMFGQDWLELWRKDSRCLVAGAVVQTFREARPVVIVAEAGPTREPIEIAFAPLRGPGGRPDRLLGLYGPASPVARGLKEVGLMTARVSVGVGEPRRAALALAAVDGRRVA